jgi:hypothetical protein
MDSSFRRSVSFAAHTVSSSFLYLSFYQFEDFVLDGFTARCAEMDGHGVNRGANPFFETGRFRACARLVRAFQNALHGIGPLFIIELCVDMV